MEPIFSPEGQVVAWLKNDVIYDEVGEPRAAIRDGAVFLFDGVYLGRLEHGYFRDYKGDAVAFMRDASGSPAAPAPRVIPTAPTTRIPLITPGIRVVPYPSSPSSHWSEMDWNVYLQPMLAVSSELEPEILPISQ